MKQKAVIALVTITVCLIIAGALQERAETDNDFVIAKTPVQIRKIAREKFSQKVAQTDKEFELLALVAVAEAEGESELGKRLVIDTVLNRVDSPYFPDTIEDVIWQKSQFESMWNGRADRCVVTDDIRKLVSQEIRDRTNDRVVYFRTKHFSSYGHPLFQEGAHYFSGI